MIQMVSFNGSSLELLRSYSQRHTGHMRNDELLTVVENLQGHIADLLCAVVTLLRQAAYHHVRITDRFDFVHVMLIDYGVERRVKLIKQLDDLHWLGIHRNRREPNDVAKVDRDIVKLFRLHFDSVS